ncbi:hypothetical protein SS50377_27313 [Spironucleus salmonicida]|uniref:Uncharacterized protein n=1 Tax=Spironucleus salmonicida TaxID=348837 RepID=V6LI48_9EUKA|nr:hypothetical protein SS50377_27313 [Spironucleus salmonicida]|eukprot:EST43386.1 Hypothetical protein SS50377_17066 [Spironucleus salmonicida]
MKTLLQLAAERLGTAQLAALPRFLLLFATPHLSFQQFHDLSLQAPLEDHFYRVFAASKQLTLGSQEAYAEFHDFTVIDSIFAARPPLLTSQPLNAIYRKQLALGPLNITRHASARILDLSGSRVDFPLPALCGLRELSLQSCGLRELGGALFAANEFRKISLAGNKLRFGVLVDIARTQRALALLDVADTRIFAGFDAREIGKVRGLMGGGSVADVSNSGLRPGDFSDVLSLLASAGSLLAANQSRRDPALQREPGQFRDAAAHFRHLEMDNIQFRGPVDLRGLDSVMLANCKFQALEHVGHIKHFEIGAQFLGGSGCRLFGQIRDMQQLRVLVVDHPIYKLAEVLDGLPVGLEFVALRLQSTAVGVQAFFQDGRQLVAGCADATWQAQPRLPALRGLDLTGGRAQFPELGGGPCQCFSVLERAYSKIACEALRLSVFSSNVTATRLRYLNLSSTRELRRKLPGVLMLLRMLDLTCFVARDVGLNDLCIAQLMAVLASSTDLRLVDMGRNKAGLAAVAQAVELLGRFPRVVLNLKGAARPPPRVQLEARQLLLTIRARPQAVLCLDLEPGLCAGFQFVCKHFFDTARHRSELGFDFDAAVMRVAGVVPPLPARNTISLARYYCEDNE